MTFRFMQVSTTRPSCQLFVVINMHGFPFDTVPFTNFPESYDFLYIYFFTNCTRFRALRNRSSPGIFCWQTGELRFVQC
jgi:hypothetical protein